MSTHDLRKRSRAIPSDRCWTLRAPRNLVEAAEVEVVEVEAAAAEEEEQDLNATPSTAGQLRIDWEAVT